MRSRTAAMAAGVATVATMGMEVSVNLTTALLLVLEPPLVAAPPLPGMRWTVAASERCRIGMPVATMTGTTGCRPTAEPV